MPDIHEFDLKIVLAKAWLILTSFFARIAVCLGDLRLLDCCHKEER